MVVIIDLYFPQLRPTYDIFRKLVSNTNAQGGEFNFCDPQYGEKYLRLCAEAEKFKKQIVELSRPHCLISWTY
jgi:hypothetical protein